MSADCGSEGRGFESRRSPSHLQEKRKAFRLGLVYCNPLAKGFVFMGALARITTKTDRKTVAPVLIYPEPASLARMIRCARSATCSLVKMWET